MRRRLRTDLIRWEAGEISAAQLAHAHPHADAVALIDLHDQLTRLTAEPALDPHPTWEALRLQMPERSYSASLRWRARRTIVSVAAAALLGGSSIAYAAGVEQVRDSVDTIVDSARSLLGGSPNDPLPPLVDEHDPGRTGDGEKDIPELNHPQVVQRDDDDRHDRDRDADDHDTKDDDTGDDDEIETDDDTDHEDGSERGSADEDTD